MPEAKSWVVGYKAWGSDGTTLLAIGKLTTQATCADVAMAQALKRVPGHIQHPGCLVRIRYVRESK